MNICGVEISNNKTLLFGLTCIYGIGKKLSKKICLKNNILQYKKIIDLNKNEIEILNNYVSNLLIENKLKSKIKEDYKRILNLNNYKSSRYKKRLPCRGQRTKTNAKTRKKFL